MMDGLQNITGSSAARAQSIQQNRGQAQEPLQEAGEERRTYQPRVAQPKPIGQWIGGGLIGLSLLDFAYNAFFKKDEASLVRKYIIPFLGAIIGFITVDVANDRRTAKDTSFGHKLGDIDSGEGYDVAETLAGISGDSVEEEAAKNRETALAEGIQIPRGEIISSDDPSKGREITSLQDVLDEVGVSFKAGDSKEQTHANIVLIKKQIRDFLKTADLSKDEKLSSYGRLMRELSEMIDPSLFTLKEIEQAIKIK